MTTQFKMTDESMFIDRADHEAIKDGHAAWKAARELEELAAAAKYHASVITTALHEVACRPSREARGHVAELADAQAVRLAPMCGLAATLEEASHELSTTLQELRGN